MSSATYIFANTGQLIRLVVQTLDGYGQRADGYTPIVQSIQYPDLSYEIGYPHNMVRLSTGLYAHGLLLPSGADALGTYIASVYWEENGVPKWETYAINVGRPFGVSSVSPV